MSQRTDLARESILAFKPTEGVRTHTAEKCGLEIFTAEVLSQAAAEKLSKPCGRYITVSSDEFSLESAPSQLYERAGVIAAEIRRLCPNAGSALAVGLGNRFITPDSIGPLVADRLLATRHIKRLAKEIDTGGLGELSVLSPGVMGQTGFEAQELIKSAVRVASPDVVVVVDALACSDENNLGRTIQLCDTGITPGSGVENARAEISEKTLGVPVVAIGVPTVIDAGVLCERESLASMFVTPRGIDSLARRLSSLISLSVNLCFHVSLTAEEIISLV